MAARRSGRVRALAVNLAVALVSILVFFAGAEILLRVTGLAPSRALRSAEIHTLERIPGIYRPGQEFTDHVRRDLPSEIRINNLGFRGPDLAERKAPGLFRVMALGDSYTFGDHVDTEEAYPARLEEDLSLRLRASRGGRAEVVNAGVNGFGILDEWALWLKAGERLDPDVVLVTFSPNDISDMTRPTPMIDQMRRHAVIKGRPVLGRTIRFLQETATFNGLQIMAAKIRIMTRSHEALPEVEPARAGPEGAPESWEEYREALVGFGAALAGSGRRAMLIHYPSHGHVTGDEPSHASGILPRWAEEAGMAYLDLLPGFREAAAGGSVLYLVPKDSHPSPDGHALAAARIAEAMARLGWLHGAGPATGPREADTTNPAEAEGSSVDDPE
jgi:lysophospholipase L1-like esterase